MTLVKNINVIMLEVQFFNNLSILRNTLASNRMSLLVGSGFSKNVSTKFPTWDELLFDLCYELYAEDIESDFRASKNKYARKSQTRSQFIKQRAQEIIKKTGYLSLVSHYIERKGYVECIATYIEERVPYVEVLDGKVVLDLNGKQQGLAPEKLSLHKALLELPWNNIFTTNYDNLLETCVNAFQYEVIAEEKNKLEAELGVVEERLGYCKSELVELERMSLKEHQIELSGELITKVNTGIDPDEAKRNTEAEKVRRELEKLENRKREIEKLIQYRDATFNQCFNIVKDASKLSIKRNKNIIKLHGSLRSKSEKELKKFEFDGDPQKQYVIAKEHYETYPQKHEAFTQLMRISLLQESFCLIGFSGTDPNFVSWIRWIRDILFKQASKIRKTNEYKIYLIDVSNVPTPRDKELFYENHSIIRIPLLQQETITFLENETQRKHDQNDSIASALNLFFLYLSHHNDIKPTVPLLELSYREQLRNAWESISLHDPNKIIHPSKLETTFNRLAEIRGKVVFADNNYTFTHNQHTLLHFSDTYLERYRNEFPNSVSILLQLILFAVEDYGLPINNALSNEVIQQLLACEKTQKRTAELIRINKCMSLPIDTDNKFEASSSEYEKMLTYAFNFQFDKLLSELDRWNPSFEKLHLKAGLLALFLPHKAEELLNEQIDTTENLLHEQQLYSMELLFFVKRCLTWHTDKKLDKLISQYKQSGFISITTHLKDLLRTVQPKESKLSPYGKNRYSISQAIHFSVHNEKSASLRYVMVLMNSGFQISYENYYLESPENWYLMFKNGFELYPLPYIFYSLQYVKEDFLKRVGQDVAFSDSLEPQLATICQTVLLGYFTAPEAIKQNILVFLSQLFVAVSPDVWQNDFFKVWKILLEEKISFDQKHSDVSSFISNAIKYITDEKLILGFIEDCLKYIDRGASQIISFLYEINSNVYFKKITSESPGSNLQNQINSFIQSLHYKPEINAFVLGNIHNLLSENQRNEIKNQLSLIDYSKLQNERIWRVLLHFANKDQVLTQMMKSAILNSHLLWYTGIKENSISKGGASFIPISAISKYTPHSNGVDWDEKELNLLYERMIMSLSDIVRVRNKGREWTSFIFELEEMLLFLERFKTELDTQTSFEAAYQRVNELYSEERRYKSLVEGLTSNDSTSVVWALNELSINIVVGSFNNDEVLLVINRILLQMEPGLEACLGSVARWLKDAIYQAHFKQFSATLSAILKKYGTYEYYPEADKAFLDETLITIASVLEQWNLKDEAIILWKQKAKISRFNNIKQLLVKSNFGS